MNVHRGERDIVVIMKRFEQSERRKIIGGAASYTVFGALLGRETATTFGLDTRVDDIRSTIFIRHGSPTKQANISTSTSSRWSPRPCASRFRRRSATGPRA